MEGGLPSLLLKTHEEIQKHIIYKLSDLNGYQYLAVASTTEEEHG